MKTTLVIMAAGIGSRFAGGIKQLEPVGPNGEIIIDYSIHDAIEAGFNKVVFIIRKDFEEAFKKVIGDRIAQICEVAYAYQDSDKLPAGFKKPDDRAKPWGTGHAVISCKGIVDTPFLVINADDYYGKEAFVKMHECLVSSVKYDNGIFEFCMPGFILKNTLSDNGGVTRGVCRLDENNNLQALVEEHNIIKTEGGARAVDADGNAAEIDENSYVSMNMWGLTPDFIDVLEEEFVKFLKDNVDNNKAEFILPVVIDMLIKEGRIKVSVYETKDKWVGVTYKEDKPDVAAYFDELIKKGVYGEKLFDN